MQGYLAIRIRLFCLLAVLLFLALTVQSFVLLSLAQNYEEQRRISSLHTQVKKEKPTSSSLVFKEKYRKCGRLAFAFVVLNSLVFAVILFFRLDRFFVRPLEKLSEIGEQYREDDFVEAGFRLHKQKPFYSLAHTLRQMLERIESDRKRLLVQVAELERVNKELVASRKQLVRSEKLATVGQLSAGLAHEIGNPLATVSGYLDMLQLSDITAEERKEYAAIGTSELERIGRLVRELLQFSRTDAPCFQDVAAGQFFHECLELAGMHKIVRRCEIELNMTGHKEMLVHISPDIMRQVILNLLLNAADALMECEQEKKKIVVQVRLLEQGELMITVRDNGMGVSEENLPHIFEPFFTTKESNKGTGLGLFVCQLLIERLGGEISATTITSGDDGAFLQREQGFAIQLVLPNTIPPSSLFSSGNLG